MVFNSYYVSDTITQTSSPEIIFVVALWRYNSHTTEFTHLKYPIQSILVYLKFCAVITTITFHTFLSLKKKKQKQPQLAMVVHAGNPSTLGGQSRQIT